MSEFYEIFLWSAGNHDYVKEVSNLFDPDNEIIKGYYSKSRCLETKNRYLDEKIYV